MGIAELSAAAKLDSEAALVRMGGNADIYESALRSTAQTMNGTLAALDKHLAANDMHGFHVDIHGLKGVLAIIGATALSREAQTLTDCAKAGDTSAVSELYPPLREKLTELAETIEKYID